jgi:hypothetical protein
VKRAVALVILLSWNCSGCAQGAHAGAAPESGAQATWSDTNKDLVRRQIEDHLAIDPGMAGLEDFVVKIDLIMNPDGSVQSAKIGPSPDSGNPNWRRFAQDCLRSVFRSSPLKMPSDKPYEIWRTMTLVFHGREMLAM